MDLAIVGAGIAGRAAASMATELGLDPLVLDEGDVDDPAIVWGIWGRRLAFLRGDRAGVVAAGAVILATGARDRSVVVPGWTLPGVIGLTEALVAAVPAVGRVLVVGSGPHLVAAAAQLHARGLRLIAIVEAAPLPRLTARDRDWLRRRGIPYFTGRALVQSLGGDRVEQSIVSQLGRDGRVVAGSEIVDDVDAIVTGFGRVAASELSRLAGCRHRWTEAHGYVPQRDEWLRTSEPGILACGDCAAPGRAPAAIAEGRLATITAAMDLGRLDRAAAELLAAPIRRRLTRAHRVDDLRQRTFRSGSALFHLARPEDVLCPCEGVSIGGLEAALEEGIADPNVAKVRTRAGMGICQARRCGEHLTWLVADRLGRQVGDVEPLSVRPPIVPIPIAALVDPDRSIESR